MKDRETYQSLPGKLSLDQVEYRRAGNMIRACKMGSVSWERDDHTEGWSWQ
jgi:hypothetical protein